MKFHRVLSFLMILACFYSCHPVQKMPNYLEHLTDTTGQTDVVVPELHIQKGDRISIQIASLARPDTHADEEFNQPAVLSGGASSGGSSSTGGSGASGYLVDGKGNILHHRLGSIHVEGMTTDSVAQEVARRLKEPVELLRDPTVIVRIVNFKFTILGQVGSAGVVPVNDDHVTILQAIGMSGGITEYGKKTNVKIIREVAGKRQVGFIDLSSKDIFDSPYYYLAQNDVIIVEGTNSKFKEEQTAKTMQKISFAFTLVTAAATIVTIFTR
jgi:polysaccharide export outer membrane protein